MIRWFRSKAKDKEVSPEITYSIITAPRDPNYLPGTIKGLGETGFFRDKKNLPLRVVAGDPNGSYLRRHQNVMGIFVDPMSEREAKDLLFPIAGNALRAVFGHRRALSPSRSNPNSKYLLLMEDDISFAHGWMDRLKVILKDVEKTFGNQFLLTLYIPGPSREPLQAYHDGKLWVHTSHQGFYGVQAILYPLEVRDLFMRETASKVNELPHDLALGKTMMALGIPILATAPSLVQHVGVKSGANSPPHSSESFLEKL